MFNNKRVSISIIFSDDELVKLKLLHHFMKTHLQRSHVAILTIEKFSRAIPEKILNKHFDPLTGIIWQPKNQESNCIVIVNSFQDGCSGFVQGFCEKNNLKYFYVSFSNAHPRYSDFAIFQYNNLGEKRVVYAISDEGKWDFFQKGNLLPFENEAYYKRRSISNRMNGEILVEYLRKLGIDIAGDDFWQAKNDSFLFRMIREEVSLSPE